MSEHSFVLPIDTSQPAGEDVWTFDPEAPPQPREPLSDGGKVSRPAGAAARALQTLLASLLVVALWFLVALWGLGDAPFHTKGEPREALVVWEMTHDGGWILPKRNGTELPSKPPLFHWLGALTSKLQGNVDEWSVRFPSALLSLLGALAVLWAGSAWWSPRAGFLAAVALMTMFEWARAATSARVDMTLTFGLEVAALSLACFWQRRTSAYLVPLYLGMAWAVLGKGPVGVALPLLTTAALIMMTFDRTAWAQHRWSATFDFGFLKQLRPWRGLLIVAVLAGTWYVLAVYVGGWPFFRKQILAENLFTFIEDRDFGGGHRHGLLYLPLYLMLGLLPWTLFLPLLAVSLWRERSRLSRTDARLPLLFWILVVFAFYEIAASKRGVYLLALYPAVALLFGWWAARQWEQIGTQAVTARVFAWFCTLLVGVVAIAILILALSGFGVHLAALVRHPEWASEVASIELALRPQWWRLALVLLLTAAVLMTARQSALRVHWSWMLTSTFVATVILLIATRMLVLPAVAEQIGLRSFMQEVRRVVGREPLFYYKTFDYAAVYYWQTHIAAYEGPWPESGPRYLLMQPEMWQKNQSAAAGTYAVVDVDGAQPQHGNRNVVLVRRIGEATTEQQ